MSRHERHGVAEVTNWKPWAGGVAAAAVIAGMVRSASEGGAVGISMLVEALPLALALGFFGGLFRAIRAARMAVAIALKVKYSRKPAVSGGRQGRPNPSKPP